MPKATPRASAPASKQTVISSFGRTTKPGLGSRAQFSSVKKDGLDSKNADINIEAQPLSPPASLKRKRCEDLEQSAESKPATQESNTTKRAKVTTDVVNTRKAVGSVEAPLTPRKLHSNPQQLPTPEATPTKPRSPAPSSPSTPSAVSALLPPSTSRQRRGQLLLTDLKGLARSAQTRPAETTVKKLPPSRANNQDRASHLFSRLQTKQAVLASLPPPPSKEEVAQRAALQRVPEVVRVLAQPPSAAEGRHQRQSWSLKSLVLSVKQSARSVLGEDEIEDCLRIVEREGERLGCKGFVQFKSFGVDKEAVIVDSRHRPRDVESRVKELQVVPQI